MKAPALAESQSAAALLASMWPWIEWCPCEAREEEGESRESQLNGALHDTPIVGEPILADSEGVIRNFLGTTVRMDRWAGQKKPNDQHACQPGRSLAYRLEAPSMKPAMLVFSLARSSSRRYIMCPAS